VRSGTTTFVKASQMVDAGAELVVVERERYVSRGGLKLQGALAAFGIDVAGRVCQDLGGIDGRIYLRHG
jgi:23S rRNA (cytidine1920-2'-O)/16S rRNA (cytidine1409-2'-O)-methyltransferase